MMTLLSTISRQLVLLFLALLLVSCGQQEPIIVYVTPTQDNVATTAEASAAAVSQVSTTATESITATITAESATATDAVLTATPMPIGDGRMIGAVIGPNYTPPPINTPRPTQPPPTTTPAATPIPETPVATPMSQVPSLNADQMGMQLYYNLTIDQWWQLLIRTERLGVGWVKMQADWSWLQPDHAGQADTTFSIFKSHVQRAHNHGFKVLVSVAKAPAWARSVTEEDGPPADPQLLADFITLMLTEVQSIDAIEIWNEPNLRREWNGSLPATGAGYMQLFQPSYDAIRAYSPDIQIVTAGLAPTGENPAIGVRDDRTFLREMYAAGLAQYGDVHVGVHPYGWGNPPDTRCCDPIPDRSWDDKPQFFFLDTLEDYREIMAANSHQSTLWVTEFGWATWSGIPTEAPEPWMLYNTPEQQKEYALRAYEIGQSLDYVGPMFLWNLNFANDTLIQNRDEKVGYSLLVPGLPPRPLYETLQTLPQ